MFSNMLKTVLLLSSAASVIGHSWVDELVIQGGVNSGSKGYIRNFQGHIDATSNYLIKGSLSEPACSPMLQSQPNFNPNPQYPQLTACPGDVIMGSWTENGHISKPPVPDTIIGVVKWFGTTDQTIKPTLQEVIDWETGYGNGKGFFISQAPFDDGVCIEDNGTPEAVKRIASGGGGPCKATFQIPSHLKNGDTLSVFWVWDFSGQHGPEKAKHRIEWYTSCMDIKISGSGSGHLPSNSTETAAPNPPGNNSSSPNGSRTHYHPSAPVPSTSVLETPVPSAPAPSVYVKPAPHLVPLTPMGRRSAKFRRYFRG